MQFYAAKDESALHLVGKREKAVQLVLISNARDDKTQNINKTENLVKTELTDKLFLFLHGTILGGHSFSRPASTLVQIKKFKN